MQQQEHHTSQQYFQSFQQGKERGFAHYFNSYYKPLYYFANRLLKNDALAEDVVADTFTRLFQKRETIQSEATIKGFLYTTVRNACFDKMEQQKTRAKHHKEINYLQQKESPSHAEDLIRTETIALVLEAIENLPKATKKVLQLHYLEGLNYEEISKITGSSKETIRKQKQLGLIALKGKLLSVLFLFFLFSL